MRLSKLLKVAKLQAIFRRLNEAFGMPYTWGSLVTCVAFQHDATRAFYPRGTPLVQRVADAAQPPR